MTKRLLLATLILFLALSVPVVAQEPIYLPLLVKDGTIVTADPILRVITQDGKIIDLLADWEIADPYWRPQIAAYKGGGDYVDSAIADGSRLVSKKYANVVESIPLTAKGTNQALAINKIRELLQVIRQAADYWTESYEYDYAWLEVRPACNDCRTGYARIVKANVPELNDPYGQPFFSAYNEAIMSDLTLVIEREPLWRGVQPGTLIGPLYNLVKNPDMELWNFGITDSQPDSWNDLESGDITGTNSREDDSNSGEYSLKVRVSQSTAINRFKGVSQVVASTRANTTYTVVAWVRNSGVSNGVGRILVTYSSQLEVYRGSSVHGWQLATGTFTTGAADTVAINLEILSTAANTDGTVYFDSLMILEGDWQQEAIDGMLPYMTSSHIVNHWDQVDSTLIEAGDLNYVDMWNVPGDESALVRLEMVNNTPDSGVNSPVVFETIRAGMRRARDVMQFGNFYDPPGVLDTAASSDDRVNSGALSTLWSTVGYFTINDADVIRNTLGRFRVLARVWDASISGTPNLEVRLRYWIGQPNVNVKTLDSVTVPARGSWYIMDLTGNVALNWDIRSKNLPGSLGFEIQMRRASGVSQGRLDYAMILPTDGGILVANVSPSVSLDSALVVDGTNSSDVYGARLERGWRQVFRTDTASENNINRMQDFAGNLFFNSGSNGKLWKYTGNGGTLIHTYSTGGFELTMGTYQGKMYVFEVGTPTTAYGVNANLSSFPGSADFTMGNSTIVYETLSWQGKFYLAARTAAATGALYSWDGSAATATLLFSSATYGLFTNITIYGGEMYISTLEAGTTNATVIKFNPTLATITVSLQTGLPGSGYEHFETYNGKLYFAANNDITPGRLYEFDGSTWRTIVPVNDRIIWMDVIEVDGRLFLAGYYPIALNGIVLSTVDAVTWRLEYLPGETNIQRAREFEISQGQLFLGTNATAAPTYLHAITVTENQYKAADYQLSEFEAPSRERNNSKRHRYFFSYDRENGVNVADDAMLIGVGIVPQYLSLIGSN